MSNDTRTIDLVINNLTEEQFENVFSPDPNELWLTPDDTPEKLAQKVDKTSDPSKIYGTDAQGNQTTYDKSEIEDKNFVFDMAIASDLWTIEHNLDKYPSVSVVDSGGNIVCGIVHYIDKNSLTIEFNGAFTGKAYLN